MTAEASGAAALRACPGLGAGTPSQARSLPRAGWILERSSRAEPAQRPEVDGHRRSPVQRPHGLQPNSALSSRGARSAAYTSFYTCLSLCPSAPRPRGAPRHQLLLCMPNLDFIRDACLFFSLAGPESKGFSRCKTNHSKDPFCRNVMWTRRVFAGGRRAVQTEGRGAERLRLSVSPPCPGFESGPDVPGATRRSRGHVRSPCSPTSRGVGVEGTVWTSVGWSVSGLSPRRPPLPSGRGDKLASDIEALTSSSATA